MAGVLLLSNFVKSLIFVEHLLEAFEALLFGVFAEFVAETFTPFLGNKHLQDLKHLDAAVGIGRRQLSVDGLAFQFFLHIEGELFQRSLAEHHHLLDIQQLGDHVNRIAAQLGDVDDTALVVDMRERQRLTTVGHDHMTQGVGDAGALIADDIRSHHGNERLDIDHHQVPL